MSFRVRVMKRDGKGMDGSIKRRNREGDDQLECRHEIRERIGGLGRGSDHMLVSLFDLK